MAGEEAGGEDRTEEATPERREEFRERGQVVVSRELTSVVVLAACVVAFTTGAPAFMAKMQRLFITHFEAIATRRLDQASLVTYLGDVWLDLLKIIVPVFLVTTVASSATTLVQTRLNWSWERLQPDFTRIFSVAGWTRMVNLQALVELLKSTAKMVAVGTVAYLILKGEWAKIPELMAYPMESAWIYWAKITRSLFWAVAGFLVLIAAADYIFNWFTHEKQIKMTKQEVKQEFKNREGDQHVKARMKRRAREISNRRTLTRTRQATVLVTNPTHYSVALKYSLGDKAPVLLAKGIDEVALAMRKIAKEEKIPIIENRPLARELYATVNEGEEIPDKFYKVVAEIIKYVFKLKGRALPAAKRRAGASVASAAPQDGPASSPDPSASPPLRASAVSDGRSGDRGDAEGRSTPKASQEDNLDGRS